MASSNVFVSIVLFVSLMALQNAAEARTLLVHHQPSSGVAVAQQLASSSSSIAAGGSNRKMMAAPGAVASMVSGKQHSCFSHTVTSRLARVARPHAPLDFSIVPTAVSANPRLSFPCLPAHKQQAAAAPLPADAYVVASPCPPVAPAGTAATAVFTVGSSVNPQVFKEVAIQVDMPKVLWSTAQLSCQTSTGSGARLVVAALEGDEGGCVGKAVAAC